MTLTQHAYIYRFPTSNSNFGQFFLIFFINAAPSYKKPRKQLQAPARKISSESSSESSEYDEESESDDGKKGLLIDISWKGRKMAVTSLNRGRREGKTNNDDNIDDDNTKKSSPGLAITLR